MNMIINRQAGKCPKGTSQGYGEQNGTIFMICDSFPNSGISHLTWAMSILGGILISCLCSTLLIQILRHIGRRRNTKIVVPPRIETESRPIHLSDLSDLSEKAYTDFCFDNLTEELKKELMILRIRRGRNLSEYIRFAQNHNSFTIATWIDHMNPGEFPKEIHEEAKKQKQKQKQEQEQVDIV
jgi:hypothetical protein